MYTFISESRREPIINIKYIPWAYLLALLPPLITNKLRKVPNGETQNKEKVPKKKDCIYTYASLAAGAAEVGGH